MEHAEARAALEVAALEPGGLDRLVAGDTAEAAALVSHLAGCPECTGELDRLARASTLIRRVLVTTPPPELRARTLDHVAALGRPRGTPPGVAVGPAPATPTPLSPPEAPHVPERPLAAASGRPRLGLWVASIAAAVLVAVVGTSLVIAPGRSTDQAAIAALSRITTWTLRIDGAADARRIALADTAGAPAGTLVFSPGTTELVVVSEALAPAPAGQEYRCWVEVDGVRRPIGRMFFGGTLAFWAGEAEAVAGMAPGATFGVSLEPLGGAAPVAEPVISGALAG